MPIRILLVLVTLMFSTSFLFSPIPATAKSSSEKSSVSSKKKTNKKTSKTTLGKVNINTATAKELTEIVGVGPKTAKAIISYRKSNGRFKTANDLLQVKGIGNITLKKMKKQLKF